MKPETKALLLGLDLVKDVYCPPGFDVDAAVARVRPVLLELERASGLEAPHESTYFCRAEFWKVMVWFSNFGNLTTLRVDAPDGNDAVPAMIDVLERAGHVYVPRSDLDEPYDGPCEWRFPTWFERFFGHAWD
jgi:hypothetical protein